MLALLFQIGSDRVALDTRCVKEVVPRVRLQRPSGSPSWLAGVFIVRGQVVPVVDLHALVGAGECPVHLSSRIILIAYGGEDEQRLLGLLAAQVAEIREATVPAEKTADALAAAGPDLGPVVAEGSQLLRLLDLDRLLPESVRHQLAALPQEALA